MKRHGRTEGNHVGTHGALWKLCCVGAVLLVLGMASCVPQPSPERDPTAWMSADELRALGDKFLAAGDTGQALQYLVAAEKKDARDPQIHYSLALAYAARRLPDQALEHFQKALQLKPDYSEAHNALGVFYAEQGKTDQAAEHFHKALANPFYRTPEKPLFNLGRIMADQGRYADALRYFDEALHFKETMRRRTSTGEGLWKPSAGKPKRAAPSRLPCFTGRMCRTPNSITAAPALPKAAPKRPSTLSVR